MLLGLIALVAALVGLTHTAPVPSDLPRAAGARAPWQMPARAGGPTVYLTYDDGPNPTATPALLDVLHRLEARATFFLIDTHVTDETAPTVRRMFAEGHGVVLHSADRWLLLATPDALAARLHEADSRIERFARRRPCRAFRPHGGSRGPSTYPQAIHISLWKD